MPNSNEVAQKLSLLHQRLIAQYSSFREQDLRTQYHPDLSQLGWHLTHIAFIEQYWLREVVLGDDSRTKGLHQNFFPELIEKNKRGDLSAITDFEQLSSSFSDTERLLSQLSSGACDHPLMKDDYLGTFLVQHAEQHMETMQMVLHQRAMTGVTEAVFAAKSFDAQEPVAPELLIAAGEYEIGSCDTLACDNEQPVHTVNLPDYKFASRMVSNAEFLGFMQADGYLQRQYWSDAGWQWSRNCQHLAPEYWQQDEDGIWYCLSAQGQSDIEADSAVSGISWYEADAFARYAGCCLPHEFEWEAAMKSDSALMLSTGQAWEWCSNTFSPYNGFQAFPYERYSSPWFDDQHYVMKGSSPFSGESVRLPSFRNFYLPGKRHVFAGLRLAQRL